MIDDFHYKVFKITASDIQDARIVLKTELLKVIDMHKYIHTYLYTYRPKKENLF